MRTTWTVVVDPEETWVRAWTTNERGDVTRLGYGPTVGDALEVAMGHRLQRYDDTMGGKPWFEQMRDGEA